MTTPSPVCWTHSDGLAVITVDHPPLNLLSAPVRSGLARALDQIAAHPEVTAAVLRCAGRSFFSGADLSEFDQAIAQPDLPTLVAQVADFPKPLVAALHGTALGGGFELALACPARIATVSARMGLPEIRLGLIPGCGGIARLTRLAGPAVALDLVSSGRTLGAAEAQSLGLLDAVSAGDLLTDARTLARELTAGAPPRPAPAPAPADLFDSFRGRTARRFRGQTAPAEVLACVERATAVPLAEALAAETEAFHRLEQGAQSKALRHVFFAEREARRLPDLPEGTRPLPIASVGILGAGTMGRGIAMSFASAGLPVTLIDKTQDGIDRATAAIAGTYARQAGRGQITEAEAAARRDRITTGTDIGALSQVDLIVEAVFEVMEVKQQVFRQLDAIARPGAILATNTSFLEIGRIAGVTSRPGHVLGLHFFSPAHVMKLLEIVRGAETAPEVLLTAVELARRIGKVGVVVGDCHGFVGNRMLARRQAAAGALILEGATPWQVDRVLHDFGLPMGPFAMADLAGLDLGWDRETSSGASIEECLCEAGRFGQKTKAGYYDYDETGQALPSALTDRLLVTLSAQKGITRREISDAEILARCLDPMIEEGRRILAEGVAARAGDIDTIWVNGYGWPAWTGGPMYWADHRGG
ncbi:3-hydroxyacyl-CoA dehydrogenase NAD-binding domain-containing protein [Pseudodonghicola flavimaris]|uniref:3-hydroxyacyl-CoA dehydrogenase NAD-binding domain-containing protein n=1 Tax=Pseudodonghicola flavimaris TaxID=3050036 RepID=A0ABT7EY98_9RHOB|nr:3-hydroxyacyl-CoA dehydrogenase NAD-binding domain-containing protein [Pseudodonghicola flavimaris]MDK3017322.1 3-hydroxyacyl-CoA dehydrogenase NAD-binding domain-containing protein [Pseudodonghicola flavimaris]